MIAAFFLVVTQMNMSRTARSAKQNESSMYANLASPGERSLVRLLDAAQHESDATPGGGGLEIDHRREDVNVVVEREHVPRLAEAVVHLVEPDAAPVGDRHGAVVQRHVNRAASASLASRITATASASDAARMTLLVRLTPTGYTRAVAVVSVHRREHALEQVPRASREAQPDLGGVGKPRCLRAALEQQRRDGVEGGAGLSGGVPELVLDARDALGGDLVHLGHEAERRERRRLLGRVLDRVTGPRPATPTAPAVHAPARPPPSGTTPRPAR
jgi:hypothetical protein